MQFQKTVTVIFLFALSINCIQAATFKFIGTGDYTNTDNWEFGKYPGTSINPTDIVIIENGAVCQIDDAITLHGELQNNGTISLNNNFINLGSFNNEYTGHVFMSNKSSFKNHHAFNNNEGAKFFARKYFYNYAKFNNNEGASFKMKDNFYNYDTMNNLGHFQNDGIVHELEKEEVEISNNELTTEKYSSKDNTRGNNSAQRILVL